jgi:hypothetical protein
MKARKMMLPAAVLAGAMTLLAPAAANAETETTPPSGESANPTFNDAYRNFAKGGAALGYGAAELVGSAYTGIALTPQLIAYSFIPQ